jgi:ribosomal protection tetracycline resistance protein
VVLPGLGRLGALSEPPVPARSAYVVEGAIPAARVHELRQALPTLTSGEGVLECRFDHYAEVSGRAAPTRPRTGHDPLDRKQYLLRVLRRVDGG